jgi:hypothetical protein
MDDMKKRTILGAVALTVALLLGLATPASARDDRPEVRRIGNCTAATDWKLKAKARDGRLEVEFEVDSNRNGQTWSFAMAQNGSRFATGTRITRPPSGSFSVERVRPDTAGVDRFVATAANARTGERCRATISI